MTPAGGAPHVPAVAPELAFTDVGGVGPGEHVDAEAEPGPGGERFPEVPGGDGPAADERSRGQFGEHQAGRADQVHRDPAHGLVDGGEYDTGPPLDTGAAERLQRSLI
jgi:hypothetical protein